MWTQRELLSCYHVFIASFSISPLCPSPVLEMELQTNPSEAFLSWSSPPSRGDTVGRRLQGGCKSSLVKFKMGQKSSLREAGKGELFPGLGGDSWTETWVMGGPVLGRVFQAEGTVVLQP